MPRINTENALEFDEEVCLLYWLEKGVRKDKLEKFTGNTQGKMIGRI